MGDKLSAPYVSLVLSTSSLPTSIAVPVRTPFAKVYPVAANAGDPRYEFSYLRVALYAWGSYKRTSSPM